MDLIYASSDKSEIGFIPTFSADIAIGADENTFAVTVDIDEHCISEGFLLYAEGTEYGGIVDTIKPSTKSMEVTYEGRTWHGILNKKIIEPDEGQNFKKVKGDAHAVLRSLIASLDLSDWFSVVSGTSTVKINTYKFDRYCPAYEGITKMLYENSGKLIMQWKNGKVNLSVIPLYDYTLDEEWNSQQLKYTISKDYHPVNHLVCLGSGNLKNRKVIHLYCDEYGELQPYASTDTPVKNSDYILTKENQVIFGESEIAVTYDYGNAESKENYVLLTAQPSDWASDYVRYFSMDDEDNYVQNQRTYSDEYTVTTSQPSDWSTKYANYFTKKNSVYSAVKGTAGTPTYKLQGKEPEDWSENYKNYHTYHNDGTTESYPSVSGVTEYSYKRQTMKPSDWDTKWTSYYQKNPIFQYILTVSVYEDGAWADTIVIQDTSEYTDDETHKLKYFKRRIKEWKYEAVSGSVAPTWTEKTYYTRYSKNVAPEWAKNTYYTKKTTVSAPTWKASTYYSLSKNVENVPSFKANTYFEKFIDDYADLINNALNRLKELNVTEKIDIQLNSDQDYDINDIVGAYESYTDISVKKRIIKKIITQRNGVESISYEIGE